MEIRQVADGAFRIELPGDVEQANTQALAVANQLRSRRRPGLLDVISGARTVLVLFDPGHLDGPALGAEIQHLDVPISPPRARLVQLPVLYGGEWGPDLNDMAARTGLDPRELMRVHSTAEYRVAFLGFAPGFPYLLGLPPELHAPRLPSPRPRVRAGSVGIAGIYSGVYPQETPGGWRLLGNCPTVLFNPLHDPPSLLQPGDRVLFRPIDEVEFRALCSQRSVPTPRTGAASLFRVLSPGLLSSVQGGPRFGWSAFGVPPGGAMDLAALCRANELLGNPWHAAGLEITLSGPTVEFVRASRICVAGADVEARINGRGLLRETPSEVKVGDQLQLGATRHGARAYVCVAGGLELPELGAPFKRLERGDVVGLASGSSKNEPPRLCPRETTTKIGATIELRVLLGPEDEFFSRQSHEQFVSQSYRVSARSDRKGIRLEGEPIKLLSPRELPPEGTPPGAIQVPPNGLPIVLGPDRPVTGGYPRIATVIGADLHLLGQAFPAATVHFREVTLAEALSVRQKRMGA